MLTEKQKGERATLAVRSQELGRALSHRRRAEVLLSVDAAGGAGRSPAELTAEMDGEAELTDYSYHARRLKKAGLLRVETTRSVRGATEHFYVLTPGGEGVVAVIKSLVDWAAPSI
jgi:hypothetical protein